MEQQSLKVRVENDKRFCTILLDGKESFHWAEGTFSGKSTCEKITVMETDKGRTKEEEVAVKALRVLSGKIAKGYKVVSGQDVLDTLEAIVAAADAKKSKTPKDNTERFAKAKEKITKIDEKIQKAKEKIAAYENNKKDVEKELKELEETNVPNKTASPATTAPATKTTEKTTAPAAAASAEKK